MHMLPEYAVKPDRTERECFCGRTVPVKDLLWVQEYQVWHAICYECGSEFIL